MVTANHEAEKLKYHYALLSNGYQIVYDGEAGGVGNTKSDGEEAGGGDGVTVKCTVSTFPAFDASSDERHASGVERERHASGVERERHASGVERERHASGVERERHASGVERERGRTLASAEKETPPTFIADGVGSTRVEAQVNALHLIVFSMGAQRISLNPFPPITCFLDPRAHLFLWAFSVHHEVAYDNLFYDGHWFSRVTISPKRGEKEKRIFCSHPMPTELQAECHAAFKALEALSPDSYTHPFPKESPKENPHHPHTLSHHLVLSLFPLAHLPHRATSGSAGYDLHVATEVPLVVPARGQLLVPTGLVLQIPNGHYGRIASRSGLAVKGIHVGAGTIDSDYRGEIKVLLCNNTDADFIVQPAMRVAQIIFERYCTFDYERAQAPEDVVHRGTGGFGSTGQI